MSRMPLELLPQLLDEVDQALETSFNGDIYHWFNDWRARHNHHPLTEHFARTVLGPEVTFGTGGLAAATIAKNVGRLTLEFLSGCNQQDKDQFLTELRNAKHLFCGALDLAKKPWTTSSTRTSS